MATAAAARPVVYDGRLGELYAIFGRNLLLNLLTLGFYRFWGRSRMRRYVWSHLAVDGDRLEYTGTGAELFRGFLIGLAIVMPILAAIAVARIMFETDRPEVYYAVLGPGYLGLTYLMYVGRYRALRYRLLRTRWRGIRAELGGTGTAFALRAFGYGIINALTLWQFAPFAFARLWRYRLSNAGLGTVRAECAARGGDIYGHFIVFLVAALVLIGILAVLAAGYAGYLFAALGQGDGATMGSMLLYILAGAAFTLVFAVVFPVARYWYLAHGFAHVAGTSRLGPLGLSLGDPPRLWWLLTTNLLMVLASLGLCYPVAVNRLCAYFGENLRIAGEIDPAAILQTAGGQFARGEGLAQLLDTDAV